MLAPGAYDALSARLVVGAGFGAVYMPGFGTAASVLSRPDSGLLTFSEMVDNARRIVGAVEVPVIADADDGNPINVVRTVQEYKAAELLARRLADARFVTAFNTMYYEMLRTEDNRLGGDRLVLFIAGNDEEAKAVVSRLIEEIGFETVDRGPLGDGGRKQQPGSPIYNNPMTAQQARETLAGLR